MDKERTDQAQMDTKRTAILAAVSAALCFAFIFAFFLGRVLPVPADVSGVKAGLSSVRCSLDPQTPVHKLGGLYFPVSGWAAAEGREIRIQDCSVLLHNASKGAYYRLNTCPQQRADAYRADGDQHDYENGGFYALVANGALEEGALYRVCLLYRNDGENALIETDLVIRKLP
jgi:hypothetical protein